MLSHTRRIAATTCAILSLFSLLALPHHSLGYSILPPSHQNGSIGRRDAAKAETPTEEWLEQRTQQRQQTSAQSQEGRSGRGRSRGRRAFLSSAAGRSSSTILSILLLPTTATTTAANAFDNRLDDRYADAPATTGAQPKDLGVKTRKSRTEGSYEGLKACGNTPNCLASSNPVADLPVRTISGWNGNGGSIKDVRRVIDTYQVGQNDIDGGGFKVIEYDEKAKYLYVQFQSYKAGYIDDFECWYNPKSGKFDVRSSSRVGYSDLGVNRLRLEYIAARLEKEFRWTFEREGNGALA